MFRGFLPLRKKPTIWGGSSHLTERCTASKPSCTRLPWTERSVKRKSKSSIFNGASNMFQHQSLKLPSPTTPAIIISASWVFCEQKNFSNCSTFRRVFCWKKSGGASPGVPLGRTKHSGSPFWSSRLGFPSGHRSFERSAGRWPSFGRAGPRGKKKWTDSTVTEIWVARKLCVVCNIY